MKAHTSNEQARQNHKKHKNTMTLVFSLFYELYNAMTQKLLGYFMFYTAQHGKSTNCIFNLHPRTRPSPDQCHVEETADQVLLIQLFRPNNPLPSKIKPGLKESKPQFQIASLICTRKPGAPTSLPSGCEYLQAQQLNSKNQKPSPKWPHLAVPGSQVLQHHCRAADSRCSKACQVQVTLQMLHLMMLKLSNVRSQVR